MTYRRNTVSRLAMAALTAATMLSSAQVAALGLGSLEIQSNLDQPLNGSIELRVAEGDDLSTLDASIAPREDFEDLGIDYPEYMKDIALRIENIDGQFYLRVFSNDVIIKEPFIHFLVRVDWAQGSFLREYTALIDPPLYAAETPQSIAEPVVVGRDQSFEVESEPELTIEDLGDDTPIDEVFSDTEPTSQTDSYVDETAVDFYQDDAAPQSDAALLGTDAQYGPVVSGESLSVIAQELQRQFPDLSIYQIMKVLFEENRSSFINENINGLLQGAVLNIGDLNAIRAVDVAEGRAFFYEQLQEWDPSVLQADRFGDDSNLLVGQDEYTYSDAADSTDYSDIGVGGGSGSTEDTFQVGSSSDTPSQVSSGGDSRAGEVLALQQQISELETALSSSSLENQELTERISLLEGQLADMNRLISLGVEDADLANMEATLAQQNNAEDNAFSDDFVDPLADLADSGANADLETGSDGFIDPLAGLDDTTGGDLDATDDVDSGLAAIQDSVIDEPAESEETAAADPAPPVSRSEPSFFEGLKGSVVDSGLWRYLAGLGALLAGGLGFWFLRRRRADEEFEISMLSIETHSQTVGEVSSSVANAASKSPDRETSFLTVYSDSDAVVQADEVDPIAEADVYIAYGRDEQAEEVLLDGIAGKPGRVDIKQKLLTLYHKNNNIESFERIAEELYSQKNFLTRDVWQEVSLMGKEIAPNNPLFDVSTSDILAEEVSQSVIDNAASDEPATEADAAAGTAPAEAASDEDAAVDFALAQEDPSINLINFDDGRSEVSMLDEVEIDALGLDPKTGEADAAGANKDETIDPDSSDAVAAADSSSNEDPFEEVIELSSEEDSTGEISVTHTSNDVSPDSGLEFDDDGAYNLTESDSDNEVEETGQAIEFEPVASDAEQADAAAGAAAEVSDLELDEDYDEARTQYELAKVFVDLGDEDGARKILDDIVANDEVNGDVLEDASELLASINS